MENPQDAEHLRLLSIFHYVLAGIVGLCSLFPLIHVAVGIGIVTGAFDMAQHGGAPPPLVGWFFILLPLVFIVVGLSLAISVAVAGRKLGRREGHLFCLIVAGLECLFMPFGMALGILTIIVLLRPSVKVLFGVAVGPTTSTVGS